MARMRSALGLSIAALLIGAAPAAAAPLGEWPLDEGSGQVAHDVTGNGHHGLLGDTAGSDFSDPAWIAGRFGSALRFLGDQDQYVSLDSPAGLEPPTVTVDAWVRRLGTPGRWRYVVSNGAVACEFASYGLYTGFDGGLAFYVSDADHFVRTPELDPAAVWDGNWHHAVGTYDGSAVRLFVDGVEVGSAPTNLTIAYEGAAGGSYIGTYHGSCERPFTGDIDQVRISSGARTDEQIADDAARDATIPMPPQTPPVSGEPAVGSPKLAARCVSISATPRRVVAGRRTKVAVTVRKSGKPVVGRKVAVRASGVKRTVLTGRRGRVNFYVRVAKRGQLTLRASGQPSRCAKVVTVKNPQPLALKKKH